MESYASAKHKCITVLHAVKMITNKQTEDILLVVTLMYSMQIKKQLRKKHKVMYYTVISTHVNQDRGSRNRDQDQDCNFQDQDQHQQK